jgi:hypothetical protein
MGFGSYPILGKEATMIGAFIKALSKQMHDMYGSVLVVPILTDDSVDHRVDKTLSWIDSLTYIFLRGILIYIAFHFLAKYW